MGDVMAKSLKNDAPAKRLNMIVTRLQNFGDNTRNPVCGGIIGYKSDINLLILYEISETRRLNNFCMVKCCAIWHDFLYNIGSVLRLEHSIIKHY